RAPRDSADALVEELAADARRLAARLRDPRATRIVWITLAEPVAVAEALDGVTWLRDRGLPLAEVIVNRTAVTNRSCPTCRARAAVERASLAPLREVARGVTFTFERDKPRAAPRASGLAAYATQKTHWVAPASLAEAERRPVPREGLVPRVSRPLRSAESLRLPETLKLIVVAGKGGVGKTTVAAGLAIETARRRAQGRRTPPQKILLLSADPAHSLGDVLGVGLGDRSQRVPGAGALEAREIDAVAALGREREGLRRAIEDAFGAPAGPGPSGSLKAGLRIDLTHDREVALRLLDLSPPGVDEILALVSVVAALDRYDLVVLDTAPTGHALKLLAMPEVAGAWLSELMRILLKYQEVARVGKLGEPIVRLSRGVRRLRDLLRDASRTRVVAVTRAAELPRLETGRLLEALDGLGISTAAVVVNAVTPPRKTCFRCRAARRAEGDEIAKLAAFSTRASGVASASCDIIVAPLALPPPRGVTRLGSWTRRWIVVPRA
ncbi:MAG: TRC40/GET3/ArsA family transport-energizing ATPase, partial [bacterium]